VKNPATERDAMGTVRRSPPQGWLRLLLRFPLSLYRLRLGWLLGSRFLCLEHVGRKSHRWRSTVLEVLRHDATSGICVIASGWGENSQWCKNLMVNPHVRFTLGFRAQTACAVRLPVDQADGELRDYGRRHPRALRALAKMMLGECFSGDDRQWRELARKLPVFRLMPAENGRRPGDSG
jgi:deazaflavin-dependent oxidoreductase (nitroreductase family)